MSEFSDYLKNAIELSGTTIYSLAKEMNYDRATLNKQLNGNRKIPKDIFLKVLDCINITEPTRKKLIALFHEELYGKYSETFEKIKDSFIMYSKTVETKDKLEFNSLEEPKNKEGICYYVEGELSVINNIKSIVFAELKEENPKIYFNFSIANQDLIAFFQSIYINNSADLDMRNIVKFSVDENRKANNLSEFVRILPLLLHGYCPYYCYCDGNIESEISLLFPYYLITNDKVMLISLDFDNAIVYYDRVIVEIFENKFIEKLAKCKRFKYEAVSFLQMPYLFGKCIEVYPKSVVGSLNERFCALPFMTEGHLIHMFGDTVENHRAIIKDLMSCYRNVNDFVALVPVESITEFVEEGTDCHTTNNFATPLTINQRIEILETIYSCIENGQKYLLFKRNEFFCSNLTFNLISDSKIIFFNSENNPDSNMMSVLTTPSGLLSELDSFFNSLCKSCYVLSKSDSLKAISDGIEYAKSILKELL